MQGGRVFISVGIVEKPKLTFGRGAFHFDDPPSPMDCLGLGGDHFDDLPSPMDCLGLEGGFHSVQVEYLN
jgi:hypothetical protein